MSTLDAFVSDMEPILKKHNFHAFVLAVSFLQDNGTLDEGFKALGEGQAIVFLLREIIQRDPKFRIILEAVLREGQVN